jgi:hypothetical protein
MSTKTAVAEVQSLKKKALEKSQENVVSALDQLDGASAAIAKATAVVKRRLEELDVVLNEFEARMRDGEMSFEREMAEMKERYTRDTTALQTRLTQAEEKLRKVQATLA